MERKAIIVTASLLALLAQEASRAELVAEKGAEMVDGAALAASCSSCHAVHQGHRLNDSPPAIPALHAYSTEQLVQSLLAYRHDEVRGTLMNRIAKGYSLTELQAIAEFLTRQ